MCFTKQRQKPRKLNKIKSKFSELIAHRQKLCQEHEYSRFFLEIMFFMEESIRQDIASPVAKMCSCANVSGQFVREGLGEAYQECSLEEKINYFQWTIKRDSKPIDIVDAEKTELYFPVSLRNFITWGSSQKAKLKGFKFITSKYVIDLRRYLVRESRSPITNSFVLEAYYPTKPKSIRFSFDQTETIDKDIDAFMIIAELGFKLNVQNWSKKVEYLQSHLKFKKQVCETKGDTEDKQRQVQNQLQQIRSQDGHKFKKKAQLRKNRFIEQSFQKKKPIYKPEQNETSRKYSLFQLKEASKNKIMKKIVMSSKGLIKNTNQPFQEKIKKKKKEKVLGHMSRNQRNIIKLLLPFYKLEDMQNIEGYTSLSNLRRNENSAYIFKHKKENRTKGKISFYGVSQKMIASGLLNFFIYPEWNRKVLKGDIFMKLESENSMMGTLFFSDKNSTPFTFISHLCEYKNDYFIVLKVYVSEDEKKKQKLSEQYFSTAIIKVSRQQNRNIGGSISLDIFSENKGTFVIDFIQSFENLVPFLQGIRSIKQHLKFGWKIDKQIENQFVDEFDRRSNEYSYSSWQFGHVETIEDDCVTEEPTFMTIRSS